MTKKWKGGEDPVPSVVGEKNADGMNAAFKLVYQIISALLFLVFFVFFVVSAIDVITYIARERKQSVMANIDPRMVNKDTNDLETIEYVKNDTENEPYNIFLQQQLISTMFILVGVAVLSFGSQFALFMGLNIYVKIRGKGEVAEKMSIPFKYLALIVIVFVIAVIINSYYRAKFLKKVQPNLEAIENRMNSVKAFIYSNLSTDTQFLTKLTSGNYEEPVQYMVDHAQKTNNTYMLSRMMFTLNLYSYFDSAFAEGDVNTDAVKNMFTPVGIRTRKVNPSYYLLYRQSAHIPDMYPTAAIRDQLQPVLGDREQQFVATTTQLMRTLNKLLSGLTQIRKGKRDVREYMFNIFGFAVVFLLISLLIIYFLFYQELEPIRTTIKDYWGALMKTATNRM